MDALGTRFIARLRNDEVLVDVGLTPEQAIQIMARNGARIMGEE